MRHIAITISLVAGLALLGCGNDSSNPNPPVDNDPSDTPTDKPDGKPVSGALEQSFDVSGCGGFETEQRVDEPTFGQTPSYCDAEVLDWSYDETAGELKLLNKRALLNCCGDHSIKVTKQSNGSYLISETDAPEDGSRCQCMCVFDFEVTVKIPKGKIDIELVREVTDSGDGTQELFAGQIDLAAGSGSVTIDATDVDPWCESETPDPAQQVKHTPEISECGGFTATKGSDAEALSYCDAEVLDWSYDAKTQQLKLADNRIQLNCCGDHEISVTKSTDGAYAITETDSAVDGARCKCACVFDFVTTIDGVTGNEITISLMRQVVDNGTAMATILFDGTLDLTAGSGTEILDANPSAWCN